MANTVATQGDLLMTSLALASIIHVERLGMHSKHTGWGFLLLPPPLPLTTFVKSAPGRETETGHVGGAGSRAPTGLRQLASKGRSAAAPRRALKARVSTQKELSAGRRGL